MEEIKCPLCCGDTFRSKEELVVHISKYKNEIVCPICLEKCLTLDALSQHLLEDSCRTLGSNENDDDKDSKITIHFDGEPDHTYTQNMNDDTNFPLNTALDSPSVKEEGINKQEVSTNHEPEEQEMFVELMNKPLPETFDMEKMQLMDESGENHYIIVSQNGATSSISTGSIVAKQNPDGTVSIKNVHDIDDGSLPTEEPVISVMDHNLSFDKEVYTCNSCGINFTSVLEHIQDFHKNEDVVVEVNESTENIVRAESKLNSEITEGSNSVATRRVITASGCIVEKNCDEENVDEIKLEIYQQGGEGESAEDAGGQSVASFEKEDNNTVPEKAPQKAPYHQVVVKEMMTVGGGQKIKVYYCTACHTYVSDLNDFKSHPCKFLKYTCMDCPASYETAKSLYSHMKIHNAEKRHVKEESPVMEGPFRCDVCDTVFMSNKSLKLHKRMHAPNKSKAIDPPVVPQTDGSEPTHEKYLCPLCSKWIPTDYRDVHDNFHDKCEKFNCDICNKKFESNDYLVMHMNVHNMDKAPVVNLKQDKHLPYDCVYCHRKFARPHEKVKHERIHTGEKPHSCEICGKSFRVSYCLTLHMRTHTGARPYECTHCGKRFKAHSVYNHHLLTHSDVRAYKCPYCPKAFKTSVQLAGHKNSHTKPFSCKQCNRPFASLYAVRVHTETHRRQNNLKYSCTLCGASYARTFALKDHMKHVHRDEVEAAENYITEFGMDEVETEETLIGK